jgi:bla regulator protein BlaR1
VLPRGYQQKEWEIVAKAPVNSRIQDFPLMLRSLLADRFHLAFHHETREMSVYELVVARGGSKLKEADPPGGGLGTSRTAQGLIHVGRDSTTLATLVDVLTTVLRMPVVDKTGLQGIFDIDFEYAQLTANAPSDGGTASLPGPTIFDALEKTLGLRLVQRKDPVEVLVVDHLDSTPTEN